MMFGLLTAPEMIMKGLTKDASSPEVPGQLVTDTLARITCKQKKGSTLNSYRPGFLFLCWVHLNSKALHSKLLQ